MNLTKKIDNLEQEFRSEQDQTFVLSYAQNENLDDPDAIQLHWPELDAKEIERTPEQQAEIDEIISTPMNAPVVKRAICNAANSEDNIRDVIPLKVEFLRHSDGAVSETVELDLSCLDLHKDSFDLTSELDDIRRKHGIDR